jgi:two-component system response regulator AtoC
MKNARGRVLVVDDERSMCELLGDGLSKRGFDVVTHTSAADVLRTLEREDLDAVVTDLNLPGMNGIELCERTTANRPDVPVIVITAFGSLDTAIGAIRAGAYDFITKPFDLEALVLALDRAIRFRSLKAQVTRLELLVADAQRYQELVGESPVMKDLYELLSRVADSEASVLLAGETGTGKELVARALHRTSRRSAGPFVAVNCAAMPEPLLESEIFGHLKGAFTDARADRKGLLQQASGGTLLLDEVGEMPIGLQPKLLRALQERTIRPVGSDTEIPFDVRIISATNRDLEASVEARTFREDLFFRLNVIRIDVPPLRSRGNDILLLAHHFIDRFSLRERKKVTGITTPAAEKLLDYGWPGNVRELQNCIERAVTLTRFAEVTVEDLPEKIRSYARTRLVIVGDDPVELVPLEEIERRYILRVLESSGGNKTVAAEILGLDRKTLYRKLERYGAADALPPKDAHGGA